MNFIYIYIYIYIYALLYHEIVVKSECVLYTVQAKKECNIWPNLVGNTIILFLQH